MLSLLKDAYQKSEEIKGRRLLNLLIFIFVFFLVFGLAVGYFTDRLLSESESQLSGEQETELYAEEVSYEGKIRYVDPQMYPEDNISFTLVDKTGKQLILLKSMDMTLVVAENQYGTVHGSLAKTTEGEDVLIVDRVTISNVSN